MMRSKKTAAPRRPTNSLRRPRIQGSANGPYVAIALVMLLVGFAGMPARVAISGYSFLFLAGVLIALATGLWMLVIPFRESLVCGLLYVFVPIYWIYYLITRWRVTLRPTLWHLGGIVLGAVAVIAIAVETRTVDGQPVASASPGETVRHVALEIKHPSQLPWRAIATWAFVKSTDGQARD
jgi:hypothetical protein